MHVIPDLLRQRAKTSPDRAAILAPGAPALGYAALGRHIDRTTISLAALGVGPGDTVAVVLRNSPEMAVCFLAVSSVAACAPLNPGYRAGEFDFFLGDLRPKAVVVESGADSPVREVAAQHNIPLVEIGFQAGAAAGAFHLEPREGMPSRPAPEDTALVLHTSGTTSRPKMVRLSHRNLLASARQIAESLGLTPEDRCLNVMPLFHIHGLVGATLSTLTAGGSLVCSPGFQAAGFFDWLEEFDPTWYTAVPTMHQAVLARATQLRWQGKGSLRFIRSSSSALPPRVMEDLEARFGVPVVEAYGMTEASHQMATNPLPPRVRKPGSVGLCAGTEIRILDAGHNSLPPGAVGEIVIRGPGVMQGYASPPEANAGAFVDGWFRTGDQGRLDADGYLFIEGRTKEIINRGGEKISPREVDEALLEHPAVAEAMAFALPDPRLGEDVAAAVVLREGAAAGEAELQEFVGARLADFKVPRRLVFLETMPKGATGKPQRIGMAERLGIAATQPPAAGEARAAARDRTEPRSPLERRLATIWAEALRLDRVGIYDDFFELGGDSLSAVQVALEVEAEIGKAFSAVDIINMPTIAEISAAVNATRGAGPQRRYLARVQPLGSRPPLFFIGGGPLQRDLARLLGQDQPFLAPAYPHLSMLTTPYSLEEIAAFHVATIRAEQPKGPYFLGGWCVDGLVAYEAAQQLRGQGEEVRLLAMFDVLLDPGRDLPGTWGLAAKASRLGRRAAFHLRSARRLGPADAVGYLGGRLATLIGRTRRRAAALAEARARPDAPAAVDFLAIQHHAAERYSPVPYEGRVLLFQRELRPGGEDPDGKLGWGDLIKDLKTQKVPGDHRDMFLEPYVRVTADALRRNLHEEQHAADAPREKEA